MDVGFQVPVLATRCKMLDLIRVTSGQGVGGLAAHFDVSRIAIMNNLGVQETAGLVISENGGGTAFDLIIDKAIVGSKLLKKATRGLG